MKDVHHRGGEIDDDRENGTNGDDRKGSFTQYRDRKSLAEQFSPLSVDMGSPIPAHDELDTAE